MESLSYEQTKELEKNVELTRRAEQICRDFKAKVTLRLDKYEGNGEFKICSDSHNAEYVAVKDDHLVWIGRFLHNYYSVPITPSAIFNGLKRGDRGVEHVESHAKHGLTRD